MQGRDAHEFSLDVTALSFFRMFEERTKTKSLSTDEAYEKEKERARE